MAFCLTKDKAEEFLRKIKSRELDVYKLSEITSAQRRETFKQVLKFDDATAKEVNALFESKLILKYQKTGIKNWIMKVGGLKPEVKRDLLSRVDKMKKILNPEDEAMFLEDLAEKRLGIGVSEEEAGKIFDLSQKAQAVRGIKGKEREYGNAVLDMDDYINSINPKQKNITANVLNVPRTLKSTFDLSAPLRQGWGMIGRPVRWSQAFGRMFKYAVSKNAYRNLQADIIGHPLYETAQAGGLRLSALAKKLEQREDEFLSTLLSKIPGVGASERAYVGFLNDLRFNVFVDLIGRAEMSGENISKGSQATKDIANVVNDFTGSGNIGKNNRLAGAVPWANAIFFSPRKISATLNMMNPKRYLDPKVSKTARKAALRNLIGMLGVTTTILGLASAAGFEVETDSNSADFGTFKIGKTRFDATGGNKTYAILLSRILTGKTKSSTTGKVKKLGEGYKPATKYSLIFDFARNKYSPVASTIAIALGDSFSKEDASIKNQLINLFVPIIIDNSIDQMAIDKDLLPFTILGELFGIGVQSY